MPPVVWNDKLSVGIASIDKQHQKLIGLLNDFYDAAQQGKGEEAFAGQLGDLIDYTKVLFANEERLFAKTGYPDAAAHKKAHEDLTQQLLEIQKKYTAGAGTALSLGTVTSLKNWLITHIRGRDKRYGPHLISKGIR